MSTTNDEGTSPLRPEVVGVDPHSELPDSDAAKAKSDGTGESEDPAVERTESIEQPAKLLRIGSMVKQLL